VLLQIGGTPAVYLAKHVLQPIFLIIHKTFVFVQNNLVTWAQAINAFPAPLLVFGIQKIKSAKFVQLDSLLTLTAVSVFALQLTLILIRITSVWAAIVLIFGMPKLKHVKLALKIHILTLIPKTVLVAPQVSSLIRLP